MMPAALYNASVAGPMFLMVEIAAISKPYNGVEKRTSGRAAAVREDTGAGAFTDRFFRNLTKGSAAQT
jgi:hypothetical protein